MSSPTGLKRRWFGNSFVNLIGGIGAAGVNVLLPAIVARHLTSESFAVWSLALQMMVFVNLLGLGLQTATARAVAHTADSHADGGARLQMIVYASRSIAKKASGVALLVVLVLAAGYPMLFPDVSPDLLGGFRITLVLFGLAAVVQILVLPDMGLFQGLHRNAVFVGVQMGSRLLTVLLVWIGVVTHQPMVVLAVLMASATALSWPVMRLVVNRGVTWAHEIGRTTLDLGLRRELLHYCGSLSVWSLSMLLVNSVGLLIVGRIDILMAGPYAIALAAASVLVGLLGAALTPLMTTAAALHANPVTRKQLPTLLTRATLWVAILLNIGMTLVIALHSQILQFWVGKSFVETTGPILLILVGAHCLRNIAAPYALMLLSTGLHKRALVSAVLEGIANVTASILLGMKWGAIGVACGTLISAVLGVLGTLLLNTGRTPELTPQPLAFSVRAVVLPLLIFMPLHLWLLIH